jgi:hypothetical protein
MDQLEAQADQCESQSPDRMRWLMAHNRLRALCVENLAHALVSAEQLQKVWSAYSQELSSVNEPSTPT